MEKTKVVIDGKLQSNLKRIDRKYFEWKKT